MELKSMQKNDKNAPIWPDPIMTLLTCVCGYTLHFGDIPSNSPIVCEKCGRQFKAGKIYYATPEFAPDKKGDS
jgi:hypothetical protein